MAGLPRAPPARLPRGGPPAPPPHPGHPLHPHLPSACAPRAPASAAPVPADGYRPVVTPNGATLPHRIVDGVKVFHLTAEPVDHEFAPGLRGHCWG
jgi:hypothetical protein